MTRFALLAVFALAACEPHVPSSRYIGTPMQLLGIPPARLDGLWYEVAAFPTPFQRGCSHTTATYDAQPDGRIALRNSCRVTGGVRQIDGIATPVGPGQLKVALQGVPVQGDYWILGAARDGRTVIVGTPTRMAGWVLHRDRYLSDEDIRSARDVFEHNGYDAAALQRTDQR